MKVYVLNRRSQTYYDDGRCDFSTYDLGVYSTKELARKAMIRHVEELARAVNFAEPIEDIEKPKLYGFEIYNHAAVIGWRMGYDKDTTCDRAEQIDYTEWDVCESL